MEKKIKGSPASALERSDRRPVLKSDNFQYNTLGRTVDRLIDQASNGPSMYYFDRLKIKQWFAGLDLGHSKLFIFTFEKL